MIDGMVSQLGEQVEKLWRRDEGGTGKYPPVSLHVSVVFTENSSSGALKAMVLKDRSIKNLFTFHFRHCWISIC